MDDKNIFSHAIAEILTVQGLLAIIMTVGITAMISLSTAVPEWYIAFWGMIIGFYFKGVVVQSQSRTTAREE